MAVHRQWMPLSCLSLRVLLLFGLGCHQGHAQEEEVKITYLWPILMTSVPLSGPEGIESHSWAEELANVGLTKYRAYVNSTLPKELELDPVYAAEYMTLDHSRVNMAFNRWQRRSYAARTGVPLHQLTSQREMLPTLPGIDYSWPELYEHKSFRTLESHIEKLSRKYLRRAGYRELPDKFRIFIWVEVFGQGDAMRPMSRTDGAYLSGKYFATGQESAIKFAFEDPRGINPPFGKTFNHEVYPGNIIMFPVWASYFITPNMKSKPVVSFSFVVYPSDGNDRHWMDDKTASYMVVDNKKVK